MRRRIEITDEIREELRLPIDDRYEKILARGEVFKDGVSVIESRRDRSESFNGK